MKLRCLILAALQLLWPGAAAARAEPGPRRKVLIIGLDGCRPDALEAADTPNIDGLRAGGAWSLRGLTGDVPISGPGWSSAFTGVWRDKHRVDDNSFAGARFDLYPTIFCRLEERRPEARAAAVVRWGPLEPNLLALCADETSAPASDAAAAAEAERLLGETDPDILFLHLNSPDSAGHASGFSPDVAAYLQAIEGNDAQIGGVLAALRGRASYPEEEWLILVTTDHGGSGRDHHDDVPENRTIFLIVSGRLAARGEIEPPPGIVDVAATVLEFLGLEIDPGWDLDGRSVGLAPGGAEDAGLQLPADCTQDGALNIADAVCLLDLIFGPGTQELLCGGAPPENAVMVLDANGDALVDVSDPIYLLLHLFRQGSAPAGGSGCVPVGGCPEVCAASGGGG